MADLNLLVAIAHDEHSHHDVARRWFMSRRAFEVRICRVIDLGVLRLLTNKHVTGGDGFTPAEAWAQLEQMYEDPRVRSEAEPLGVLPLMREWTQDRRMRASDWVDAYLAAFAHQAGLCLATLDRGMLHFPVDAEVVE